MTTTRAAMDTNNNGKNELPDQSKASETGRSCKGTLYYSSALKSKAYNPLCVGIPRAIPEAFSWQKNGSKDTCCRSCLCPCPSQTGQDVSCKTGTQIMRSHDHEVPQTQRQQPTQSAGSLFFNRFTRNADLVASGVTKNVRKVGKYVRGSIYEFLYSYRGRPK